VKNNVVQKVQPKKKGKKKEAIEVSKSLDTNVGNTS
jgi:hypothetical protein